MPFCVDTSGWLDGWRRNYPPDVFKTLWASIELLVDQGEIIASEEVHVEIAKKDDDLHNVRHLYEPVSFDPADPGSIVEKANRWLGRGMAIHDFPERFKIHFLLAEPKREGTEITQHDGAAN